MPSPISYPLAPPASDAPLTPPDNLQRARRKWWPGSLVATSHDHRLRPSASDTHPLSLLTTPDDRRESGRHQRPFTTSASTHPSQSSVVDTYDMVITLLLLLLPLTASLPMSSCGFCPPQSKCELESNGRASCQCTDGFSGSNCDIPLCHSSLCLGPHSICENTLRGPVCHCEQGREGGETQPWSRCANSTYCEASFQNGKCDELCNNPECLFDGNDCEDESIDIQDDQDDTVVVPDPTVSSDLPDSSCSSIDLSLILFAGLLIVCIVLVFLCACRGSKKTATRAAKPPLCPIPPTPQPSDYCTSNYDKINYDEMIKYVTVPTISHSVAQSVCSDYSDIV